MRNSQVFIGVVFAASLGFALGNCGSSSSSGNGLTCPPGGTGSCTQAEVDTYDNCVLGQCGTQFTACYGTGYKTGNLSGPCATYGTCVQKCGCNDSACKTACGLPPSACLTCLVDVGTCTTSSTCMRPACLAGAGSGGTSGGAGGHVGGLGGFTGSLGGFTGGSGTCADLLACCNATSTALKGACMSAYNTVVSSGDASCGAVLSGIKSTYCP